MKKTKIRVYHCNHFSHLVVTDVEVKQPENGKEVHSAVRKIYGKNVVDFAYSVHGKYFSWNADHNLSDGKFEIKQIKV